jgi:hypothetical protein
MSLDVLIVAGMGWIGMPTAAYWWTRYALLRALG